MHLRIIILEDTPSEFMQTKHALEQYADLYHHTFEIVWVQNESSLIRMYHAQSFDLLFADIEIKLPNASSSENGIIICKKLRELQYSGDIIFLTNFQECTCLQLSSETDYTGSSHPLYGCIPATT